MAEMLQGIRLQLLFFHRVESRSGHMKPIYLTIAGLILAVNSAGAAEVFSINDALRQAMLTNPAVGEASANRRATQSELRQTQSTLLPQVRIEASYGPEKFDQSRRGLYTPSRLPVPVVGAGPWRNGDSVNPSSSDNCFLTVSRRSTRCGVKRHGLMLPPLASKKEPN